MQTLQRAKGTSQQQDWNTECIGLESTKQTGEFENVYAEEFVIGVCEVRWKEQGEIISDDYTVHYSGDERTEGGCNEGLFQPKLWEHFGALLI
jgi:hypothetical protein